MPCLARAQTTITLGCLYVGTERDLATRREFSVQFLSVNSFICYFSNRAQCVWTLTVASIKVHTHRDTPDAIGQRDAIFRFSLTDNFDPSLNFTNISKRCNILSYLVYISFKICSHWLFYQLSKTKKSRRVVERVRCVWTFKVHTDRTRFGNATRIFSFQ
jgi:hypothetical protein